MQAQSLPRTTKAAIHTELRTPLVVGSIRLPEELDVGQVLVQVHFSGICGSQLGEIDGAKVKINFFLIHLAMKVPS